MKEGDLTGSTCGACNHYMRVLAVLANWIVEECPNCGMTFDHERKEK